MFQFSLSHFVFVVNGNLHTGLLNGKVKGNVAYPLFLGLWLGCGEANALLC